MQKHTKKRTEIKNNKKQNNNKKKQKNIF